MNNEFGPNFITLTDDEGNNIDLEYVDALEVNGQTYMAFLPAEYEDEDNDPTKDLEEDDLGLIILKAIEEDGEEQLSTLDSEEELEMVYEKFMEILFTEDEE